MPTKSISHCQGKGSISHNNRDFSFKNVDPSRTKDNITYVQQPILEAYRECFGKALEEFNGRQTREDRKIADYYAHLFGNQKQNSVAVGANKQKSFYENLVQVGTRDDSGVGSADGELVAKCLDEYMRGFQERNPQFHVFNAVLHMDEATPHLHIDYIPVAVQTKGMAKQNGIAKALEQMGHGKGVDAINRWRLSERKVLEEICNRHGIEISEPKESRGSLSPDEYKAMKDEIKKQAELEAEEIRSEIPKIKEQAYTESQEAFHGDYASAFAELERIRGEIGRLEQESLQMQAWLIQEEVRVAAENKTKHDKLPKIDYSKHRPTFGGKNMVVPKEDYELMRSRSEWYRRGIGLKEREAKVAEREAANLENVAAFEQHKESWAMHFKSEREALADERSAFQSHCEARESGLNERERDVNQYEASLQDWMRKREPELKKTQDALSMAITKISSLENRVSELRGDTHNHMREVERQKDRLKQVCAGFIRVVKALNMLKHEDYAASPLTPHQSQLIDAINEYAKKEIRDSGYRYLSTSNQNQEQNQEENEDDDMLKAGISYVIKKIMDPKSKRHIRPSLVPMKQRARNKERITATRQTPTQNKNQSRNQSQVARPSGPAR